MRTSTNQVDENGVLVNGYDYSKQCWVIDGIVQNCGHPSGSCSCYGREHAGESIDDGKVTISGIDCYGKVVPGNSIEVIPADGESWLLDNDRFHTWNQVINWLTVSGYAQVAELVADK